MNYAQNEYCLIFLILHIHPNIISCQNVKHCYLAHYDTQMLTSNLLKATRLVIFVLYFLFSKYLFFVSFQ